MRGSGCGERGSDPDPHGRAVLAQIALLAAIAGHLASQQARQHPLLMGPVVWMREVGEAAPDQIFTLIAEDGANRRIGVDEPPLQIELLDADGGLLKEKLEPIGFFRLRGLASGRVGYARW